MSFLNPEILWALPVAGLPVAIHLINRLRVHKMRWAAMRFLSESLRVNQRKLRLEDLLLLALRCLLILLAVLAFARPVRRSLLPAASGGGGTDVVVVLLDHSAGMGQSDGVATRFEQAKTAIRDRLDHARPDAAYGLFLVSNRVDPVLSRPTADLASFRRALDLASLSERPSDLSVGIRAAYEALKPWHDRASEIDVYTDGQASGWSHLDDIRRLRDDHPGVRLVPIILGKQGEDNLGVIKLAPEGGALAANQPCRFKVEVGNYGAKPVDGVRVTLAVDGQAPSDETVIPHIESGAIRAADLLVRFPTPGDHFVTAAIASDRLAIDNQRAVAVQVVGRQRALVFEGGNAAAAEDRDGFFLANALAPYSRARAAQSSLAVATAPAGTLNKASLEGNALVCLCNPGALPANAGADLSAYVLGGGNLIIFPGPLTDPARWQRDPAMWNLLPATPGAAKLPGSSTPTLHWQASGFDHPVTALWNDPSEGTLGGITATGYFPLTLRSASENPGKVAANAPAVLVHYTNDAPAAVEWAVGQGSVTLFAGPAAPPWTDLPMHPVFVPFVQRLWGYLGQRHGAPLSLAPGTPFQATVPLELLGQEFSVLGPEKDARKRVAGQVELDGERAVMRVTDTDAVGAYRLFVGQEDTPRAVFAVQLDPAVSDLRQIDPRELEPLAREADSKTASPTSDLPTLSVTREFWTLLVGVVAALALVELTLAQRFSRSR